MPIYLNGDILTKQHSDILKRILENMTHIDMPWRAIRKRLTINELSDKIIDKELILEYFHDIKTKYNMLNISDIRDYSVDIFNKINN